MISAGGVERADLIRPVLAIALFEPCSPCLGIGALNVGDGGVIDSRRQRGGDVLVDEVAGVFDTDWALLHPVDHRRAAFVVDRLGRGGRRGHKHYAGQPGEASRF